MPKEWSKKEERMYEHIKSSEKKEGKSEKRAKQIAASTVNKRRRKKGETSNRTTKGTGNPNQSLEDRTKKELYNRAKNLNIEGRSRMNKRELVKAIRRKQ